MGVLLVHLRVLDVLVHRLGDLVEVVVGHDGLDVVGAGLGIGLLRRRK